MKEERRRGVIVVNGQMTNPELMARRVRPGDTVICADGGTLHAERMGLTPHVIVGDMDSVPPSLRGRFEAGGTRLFEHPPRKDETDLELALRVAKGEGLREIIVLCPFGGRVDQELANLLLITRPEWRDMSITLADEHQQARLLRPGRPLRIDGMPGDIVSLIPVSDGVQGLTIEGVEWPLEKHAVQMGSTLTISNVMLGKSASVSSTGGLAIVVQISYNQRR